MATLGENGPSERDSAPASRTAPVLATAAYGEPVTTTRPDPSVGRPPLPAGFRIDLDRTARWLAAADTLAGGRPVRYLRLTPAGRRCLQLLLDGHPVPPGDPTCGTLARRLVDAGIAHPVPPSTPPAIEVGLVVPVRDHGPALDRLLASPGWPSPRAAPSRAVLSVPTRDRLGGPGAGRDGGPVRRVPVVIVDDGSRAPVELDAADGTSVTVLRLDQAQGPAAARNRGAVHLGTDLVAFVDADVTLPTGWLEPLVAHFADPTVAAVAPRVAVAPSDGVSPREGEVASVTSGPPRVCRGRRATARLVAYEHSRSPLDLGTEPAVVRPGGPVPYVPAATLLVRRSAWVAVGGFDEHLTVGEDVDLVWRLHQAGWTTRYVPSVVVHHAPRTTVGSWLRQRATYGTSAAPLAHRHHGQVVPVRVDRPAAAGLVAASIGRPLAAGAAVVGQIVALRRRLGWLPDPTAEATDLVALGQVAAVDALASALRREWVPLAIAALAWRHGRRAVLAAWLVPPTLRWLTSDRRVPWPWWMGLHLADDAAYGIGVWQGCLREHSVAPLLPALSAGTRRAFRGTGVGER